MSNVTALLKGRGIDVAEGIYLERADNREHIAEEYLRAFIAHVPALRSQDKRLQNFLKQALELEPEMIAQANPDLQQTFKNACFDIQRAGFEDALVARVFAAIREASKRILGMRHHDVQLLGGWALLQGKIAEMATGEGKTLVATLAACTAAGSGAAVHVITVNDYLSKRDAQVNSPLYDFLGFSIGIIEQGMEPAQRREQYSKDITYVSNKEIVFDYLKDSIATGSISGAQFGLRRLYRDTQNLAPLLRGLHVAIVDEADSVLIDEARTPLIISETIHDENGPELYQTALNLAASLSKGEHFEISQQRELWLTTAGEKRVKELTTSLGGLWLSEVWRREIMEKALCALHLYTLDQHYIIQEDKIQIVDEFTGRVMPDRSWESGLHQMIEAKEGVTITGQRKTLSRMTYQRFFKRYILLAGMTGTAAEIAPELRRIYDLQILKIPTNRPSQRRYLPHQCYLTHEQRWQAITNRAIELSQQGRAVLIGTRSVEASEQLALRFIQRGIAHTTLNARQDQEEANIVSLAGQPGRITIATNMAGRGTDIKLEEAVVESGGLHVILSEFHESSRVDRQLFGRSARQGQPGSVEAIVCIQDELFHRYAVTLSSVIIKTSKKNACIAPRLLKMLVRIAQMFAEQHNRGIRMRTLKQDKKLQKMLGFSGTPN